MLTAFCLIVAPPLLVYGICAAFTVPRHTADRQPPAELVRLGQGRQEQEKTPAQPFGSQRTGGRSTPHEA